MLPTSSMGAPVSTGGSFADKQLHSGPTALGSPYSTISDLAAPAWFVFLNIAATLVLMMRAGQRLAMALLSAREVLTGTTSPTACEFPCCRPPVA
jgi:hypothetical protein